MPRPHLAVPKGIYGAFRYCLNSGRMVLFPSWLRHHVPSNEGTTERISIAFNLMFTSFAETIATPMWKPTAGAD